jgi:sulfite exporter TauE/SafE
LEYTPFIALTVGLFSVLHCLGMCGGIVGALTFSLPAEIRESRWRLLPFLAAYNAGRIASYTAAGAVLGATGATLFRAISPRYGHAALQAIATLILIGVGLYLAGWFPRFALIERLGVPVWQQLEPIGRRMIPVRSLPQAFLFGLVWGWLPCGLVYSALFWTVSAGSAGAGALFMLAFGIGTLPGVITAGILAGWMARLGRIPYARQAVGLMVIAVALGGLWFVGLQPTGHEHVP